MRNYREIAPLSVFFLAFLLALTSHVAGDDAAPASKPAEAKTTREASPIMPLDQVRIGMKGYGLTVFHGAKIEPFPVEVISVMRDFAPKRGVVWIRCDDPRLEKSGPVQGMSGSPIYLWDENEKGEIGKGGKMIGAFAFGFSWTKDCYAGVQPIELMRETGGRIDLKAEPVKLPGVGVEKPAKPQGATGATLLDLLRYAEARGLKESATWQAQTFAKALGVKVEDARDSARDASRVAVDAPKQLDGKPVRLMLPMNVGSELVASTLAPMMEPLGIQPLHAPMGAPAGLTPPGIDGKAIKLEPGSVLSIPLAFGDADMSATGTVTDVLPDGRVLAFGHPMFGQGDVAMPMATGYVHFVVPRVPGSFKLGGSAVIQGTILRDDASAVAGAPVKKFRTAPVKLNVNIAGRKRTYNYEIVHHERLTPSLVAAVITQSLTAEQNLPTENTLRIKGAAVFDGNRKVEFNSTMAPGVDQRIMFELVPAFATMIQNPHDAMGLVSLELDLDVSKKIEAMQILGARVEKATVEPGEEVKVTVTLQSYGEDRLTKRISLKTPDSLPEGRYMLSIGDSRTINRMLMTNRPHMMMTTSADDVHDVVKTIVGIRGDMLYAVLQLPPTGIVVGRQELPRLPSSKRALIASAQDTIATPFADWIQVAEPMNAAVTGEAALEIEVVKGK